MDKHKCTSLRNEINRTIKEDRVEEYVQLQSITKNKLTQIKYIKM